MTSRLYWIGQYEGHAKKWEWFFQFDLAPAIGHGTKRVVGEGKHTQPCGASIDMNERTYSHGSAILPRRPVRRPLAEQLPRQPGCTSLCAALPAGV
jgi:hypothetical protein